MHVINKTVIVKSNKTKTLQNKNFSRHIRVHIGNYCINKI